MIDIARSTTPPVILKLSILTPKADSIKPPARAKTEASTYTTTTTVAVIFFTYSGRSTARGPIMANFLIGFIIA